jgi:hypothetical protein
MTDTNEEQAMLRRAAIKEIGARLKRELTPEEQTPERLRELLARLEANEDRKSEE